MLRDDIHRLLMLQRLANKNHSAGIQVGKDHWNKDRQFPNPVLRQFRRRRFILPLFISFAVSAFLLASIDYFV